jgi:hypothetical protein
MPTHTIATELTTPEQAQPLDLKVLIVTTRRWFSAARLAMAFSAAGAQVELASPSEHPAMLTRSITAHHHFRALQPLRSLLAAFRTCRPNLVVPTDDTITLYLHRLYNEVPGIDHAFAPFVRSLLQRSLGDPASFPILNSRTDLLAVAHQEGILTPPTEHVPNKAALHAWLACNSLPAVLKADGTSGGEGVEIVSTAKQALRAWRKLRAPLGLARVVKKTGFEQDAHHIIPWVTRRPRRVSIQPFIAGQDANMAVACWQGEVLGAVSLDVLHTWRPKGPSALVELTQNDAMWAAARAIVRRLNLSGLCGFDFIVENPGSQQPSGKHAQTWLIELNARATQTCHLPYGTPRDLISALVAELAGRPLPAGSEASRNGVIALFPLAWQAGISNQALASTLQDIPWEEPLLVEAGFALPSESFYEKCKKLWQRAALPHPVTGESK